jgi:hypothetical protein
MVNEKLDRLYERVAMSEKLLENIEYVLNNICESSFFDNLKKQLISVFKSYGLQNIVDKIKNMDKNKLKNNIDDILFTIQTKIKTLGNKDLKDLINTVNIYKKRLFTISEVKESLSRLDSLYESVCKEAKFKIGQTYEIPEKEVKNISNKYPVDKESFSSKDIHKESESGIWYDDVEEIVEEVGKKVNYSSSDKLWADLNKILYSVRNQKGSRDMGLSNKEVQILKQAIKKYNIRGINSDVLKESLSSESVCKESDYTDIKEEIIEDINEYKKKGKNVDQILNMLMEYKVFKNFLSKYIGSIFNIKSWIYDVFRTGSESFSRLDRLYESVCKEGFKIGDSVLYNGMKAEITGYYANDSEYEISVNGKYMYVPTSQLTKESFLSKDIHREELRVDSKYINKLKNNKIDFEDVGTGQYVYVDESDSKVLYDLGIPYREMFSK